MNSRIISDISDFIFVEDKPQKVDAIFLPGGSHPEQPEFAAQLYREGFTPWLIPAGGLSVKLSSWQGVRSKADIYNGKYETDCEFFTDVLIKNGVPETAIIKENSSGHTRDNAFLSRKVADECDLDIKSAIIVCKSFHARRCLMFYRLAFPKTDILVCPVTCYGITRNNWFLSEYGIERVLGELSRCGNQFDGDIKRGLSEINSLIE